MTENGYYWNPGDTINGGLQVKICSITWRKMIPSCCLFSQSERVLIKNFFCNHVSGHIVELAEKYGGLIFGVEHRFYGLSTFENCLETENLRYLSSQQA